MSRKELKTVIDNLVASFDGKPWYGISMMDKLNEIPWQIVNEKTYGSKTIAILLQHIINWRVFVLKKLEGDLEFNIVIDGENDWDQLYVENEEEWNSLVRKLQNSQEELIQKLSVQTDELLVKQVPGKDYLFGPILTSIGQHDIYHLGQIAMLNAMHKS